MEIRDIPIRKLIPQRPPFLLVDRVLSCNQADAVTEFLVSEGHLLLDDDQTLSVAGIIENMAQSCAARMGCVDWMRHEPIKIGFIGDVRDAQILRHPHCQELLRTRVHIIEDVFNLMLAQVTVTAGDETVATALMKIAMTDIVATMDD